MTRNVTVMEEKGAREIIHDTAQGAMLSVHVQPKASHTECVGLHGNRLKFRVAAPPVDGTANETLCRYLAEKIPTIKKIQLLSVPVRRHVRSEFS